MTTDTYEGGVEAPNRSASDSTPEPASDAPTDPDLATVVAGWADLPPAVRLGMVALVKAYGNNAGVRDA